MRVVGIPVCRSEVAEKALPVRRLRRYLGQPDRGLHRLDLAEEWADITELVMTPMLKKTGRLRRDLPLTGIGQRSPRVHRLANFIDDRRGVVLLLLRRKPKPSSEVISSCTAAFFRFFGLGIGVMNSARRRVSTVVVTPRARSLPALTWGFPEDTPQKNAEAGHPSRAQATPVG
jgi:hypothetical protein